MNTSPDIHAYSRALGSLEASVKAVTDTVANMTKAWGEQESNASAGRRVIHDKLDEVKEDLSALTSRVDAMTKEISIEIGPAVREFKDQRQRAIGAKNFGKYLWGAMLTAAGGIGWIISEWLHIPKGH